MISHKCNICFKESFEKQSEADRCSSVPPPPPSFLLRLEEFLLVLLVVAAAAAAAFVFVIVSDVKNETSFAF